jgi:hypothetical protein
MELIPATVALVAVPMLHQKQWILTTATLVLCEDLLYCGPFSQAVTHCHAENHESDSVPVPRPRYVGCEI